MRRRRRYRRDEYGQGRTPARNSRARWNLKEIKEKEAAERGWKYVRK
jgi:hypothetical protein